MVIASFQEIPALGLSPQSNRQSQTNRRPRRSTAPRAPATQRTQGRRRGVLGSSPRPTAPHGRSGTAVMRRARPASGGAPDTAAVSQIPPRSLRYQRGISDTSPVSRRLRRSPSRTRRLSPPPLTAHYCSALRRIQGTQDTATRRAEQRRHTGQGVAQCRRVAAALWIVGVDIVLAVQYSLRSCRSTTSTVAVRERSYTAHDTAPVSQILSQYPGILRRYPRYQSGIPAVV